MAPSKSVVRTFRHEDLPHLIRLCDITLAGNPHFIRDENFLKYFMHYHGVDEDSIFVASIDDEITGLAILSITTEEGELRQGSIIELQAKDVSSMHALIQTSLDYCKDKDVDTAIVMQICLPGAEVAFKDWLKLDAGVMMTRTLSPSSLLQVLLSKEEVRGFYAGKKLVFYIGDEMVEISNIDSKIEEPSISVIMSLETFHKIIFGQLNPYVAYLTRRVKVRGVWNILPIMKLLGMMKLPTPLYMSLVDRM